MKVEIWSDVMCPFCYIGKRRFEKALDQFADKKNVEVVWKSFQLNPDMKTDPSKNITQYLAEAKGWPLDYARQMNANVTGMAKEEGLEYRFDQAVVANSFDAHRLVQLAKTKGKGDAAEEALFHAYFTDGKNIADHGTLITLGVSIGLDKDEIRQMLETNAFADDVERDVYQAQKYGARGVPFFVFNERYGVSGAQASDVFSQALERAFTEWKQSLPLEHLKGDGESCDVEGKCE